MDIDKKIDMLFDELVPECGAADNVAGEIIRALGRLRYRYYNDGDLIGIGYGNETCNAAARFLQKHTTPEISRIIELMWGLMIKAQYEDLLNDLSAAVAKFIEDKPELKTTENTDDMWNYQTDDDIDYSDEDDEWEEEY